MGILAFVVVWPLMCFVLGGPLVLLSEKFVTRTRWEQTTMPGMFDDRPPPKWHAVVHYLLMGSAFAAGWLSLPLALWLTAGR